MSWNNIAHMESGNHRLMDSETRFGMSTLTSRFNSDLKPSMSLLAKGKNHPSFTIILRRQLPVNFAFNEEQDAVSNTNTNWSNDVEDSFDSKVPASPKEGSIPNKADILPVCLNKHNFALEYAWQIWLLDDKETICNDWNVKKHGQAVKTGRDFWNVYTQIYDKFDKLDFKNLMIFQETIEPKWEDKSNIGGGRWYFDVSYNMRSESSRRDCLIKQNYWTHCLETVMSGCLGPQANLIVGMILHFKSCKYRVSLWIRSCDFNQVIQLGASLRKFLNLRCQLKFELHSATTCPTSKTETTGE